MQTVRRALDESGADPRRLEIEITENAFLQNAQEALQTLRRLRGLGVRISIDDFGTGYSSLSYLRRFPVDTLKIDRSLVRGVDARRQQRRDHRRDRGDGARASRSRRWPRASRATAQRDVLRAPGLPADAGLPVRQAGAGRGIHDQPAPGATRLRWSTPLTEERRLMDKVLSPRVLAILVTAGLSLLAVIGDYFLKRASSADAPVPDRLVPHRLRDLRVDGVRQRVRVPPPEAGDLRRHLRRVPRGDAHAARASWGSGRHCGRTEVLGIGMAVGALVLLTRFA